VRQGGKEREREGGREVGREAGREPGEGGKVGGSGGSILESQLQRGRVEAPSRTSIPPIGSHQ